MENSSWKTKVSYFLYGEFKKRDFNYSLEELKQKASDMNFEAKMFAELEDSAKDLKISMIIVVVNKFLDEI